MSSSSPGPAQPSPVSWGMALAATSLMLIGGGALIWTHQGEDPPNAGTDASAPPEVLAMKLPPRTIPTPPPDTPIAVHTITYTVEHGTRVVKIRVVPDGDEIIVDAATGRLLETRPNRPTAPPPMGKFAAPFDPMT